MSRTTGAQRVKRHRAALRAQGLWPIQIWVPDTRAPGFAEECARQAAIVDEANHADPELMRFMDTAAADLAEHLDALEASGRGQRANIVTVALEGEHGNPDPRPGDPSLGRSVFRLRLPKAVAGAWSIRSSRHVRVASAGFRIPRRCRQTARVPCLRGSPSDLRIDRLLDLREPPLIVAGVPPDQPLVRPTPHQRTADELRPCRGSIAE